MYERLTCEEHFELFSRAYGLDEQTERDSRARIYGQLGFERYATTRADRLSASTLSQLNLSVALLADPEVLLLDEPYAGFTGIRGDYVLGAAVRARRRRAGCPLPGAGRPLSSARRRRNSGR